MPRRPGVSKRRQRQPPAKLRRFWQRSSCRRQSYETCFAKEWRLMDQCGGLGILQIGLVLIVGSFGTEFRSLYGFWRFVSGILKDFQVIEAAFMVRQWAASVRMVFLIQGLRGGMSLISFFKTSESPYPHFEISGKTCQHKRTTGIGEAAARPGRDQPCQYLLPPVPWKKVVAKARRHTSPVAIGPQLVLNLEDSQTGYPLPPRNSFRLNWWCKTGGFRYHDSAI